MPEYLSPGVYVEEIDAGPKPIEGVSTSTAGAVGVTERGPSEGKPLLVTSFADFVRKFGGPLAEPPPGQQVSWHDKASGGEWWRFPLSVKGFFDNGGQRLFVKRVSASKAVESSVQLERGLYLDIDKPAKKTDTTLALSRLSGLLGIENGASVTLIKLGGAVNTALVVQSYDSGANMVVFTAAIGSDVAPGLWVLEVKAPPSGAGVAKNSVRFRAYGVGNWGDQIRVRMTPMVSAALGLMPNRGMTGNAPVQTSVSAKIPKGSTTIEMNSLVGLATNDPVQIEGAQYTLSALGNVATLGSAHSGVAAGAVAILDATETTTLAGALATGDTSINVTSASALSAGNDVVIVSTSGGGSVFLLNLGAFTSPNTFSITAGNSGVVGDKVYKVRATTTTPGAAAGSTVPLASDATEASKDKLFVAGSSLMDIASVRRSATVPAPGTQTELLAGTLVRKLRKAVDPASPKIVFLNNASSLYEDALLEFDNGSHKERAIVASRVGSRVELKSALGNVYFDTDVARLMEGRLEVEYQRDPTKPKVTELFEALRLKDDGSPQYLVKRVNEGSALVRIADADIDADWAGRQPDLDSFPSSTHGEWASLANGDDHLELLLPDDFVGEDKGPGKRSGIAALEDIDEISICLAPGMWASDVRKALIEHCELLKDRFAVVDPTPAELLSDAERIDHETIKARIDSKYGAVYYPWLVGRDFVARTNVRLPPSGHMAGIYARSDVERGVHKAPANEVVRGIDRFEIDITKREQDLLNPKGVNALRYFPGRGLRVWGARTLTSDASWKYVNVRRLFIYVEESIDEGTQWVVFEPNDEPLWARVRQTINQFLDRLWREGMLQGATRDEAYFIKCDRTTMTQDEIDNGKLICVIGIAPVKPAEFVIFRIQQKTLDQRA